MSSNRNQHVVPQFYLRHFADGNKKVHFFEKQTGRISATGPKRIGHEEDAFSIISGSSRDDFFDKINNTVETFCAPQLVRLAQGTIDDVVLQSARIFTANMILHSRRLRDQQRRQNQFIADFMKKVPQTMVDEAQADPFLKRFNFDKWNPLAGAEAVEKASEITFQVSQVLVDSIASRLADRHLVMLQAPPEREFITSDDPVVFLKNASPVKSNQGHIALLDDREVEVFIVLLPTLAFAWKHAVSDNQKLLLTDEMFDQYNKLIASTAYKQMYSSSEYRLREVAISCGIEIIERNTRRQD